MAWDTPLYECDGWKVIAGRHGVPDRYEVITPRCGVSYTAETLQSAIAHLHEDKDAPPPSDTWLLEFIAEAETNRA